MNITHSYMLQKASSKLEWGVHTLLEQTDETLTVKLVDFLQVSKDDVLFTTQRLWQRAVVHLWNVIINNVLQRSNVVGFGVNQLLHYQQLSSAYITCQEVKQAMCDQVTSSKNSRSSLASSKLHFTISKTSSSVLHCTK